MFPMFDNEFLFPSKIINIAVKYCVFTTKQDVICDNNLQCFISDGLMLDDIIKN